MDGVEYKELLKEERKSHEHAIMDVELVKLMFNYYLDNRYVLWSGGNKVTNNIFVNLCLFIDKKLKRKIRK